VAPQAARRGPRPAAMWSAAELPLHTPAAQQWT
jgi:hypothetical protein